MEGSHLADTRGEGGIKGVEPPEKGPGCDEGGGNPDHGPDWSVKATELVVIQVFPDGGEFEIVSLESEDMRVIKLPVVEAEVDR